MTKSRIKEAMMTIASRHAISGKAEPLIFAMTPAIASPFA